MPRTPARVSRTVTHRRSGSEVTFACMEHQDGRFLLGLNEGLDEAGKSLAQLPGSAHNEDAKLWS